MNNGKIRISKYRDTILIDLHTQDKIFNQDVFWISRIVKEKFRKKLNVIALISGNYILCEKAKKLIASNKHHIGDAIAFVIPNTNRQINDLYYAQFYFLKDKNVAYFSNIDDAHSWIQSSS
jgi:hypothetical protein